MKKTSCELRYRESGGETGRKEGVKMSNVRPDPEIFHPAKKNISVNCMSPGGVLNNHSAGFQSQYAKKCPVDRMANVSEIADAIMLFCENKNAYLTGQNLIVDGSFTAW